MEMVWAVITPLVITSDSNIQKIVLGSLYSKPNSHKKTALLDHIAEVYQLLYQRGLHWIIAGDFNDLNHKKNLDISPKFQQLVTKPTRENPPRILDKIVTTLGAYYQEPNFIPPLDNDPEKNGKPSDHSIVIMSAINVINNKPARTKREITYMPITEAGLEKMEDWLKCEEWTCVKKGDTHEKAQDLMSLLSRKTNDFFPQKSRKICSDTQPFFNRKFGTRAQGLRKV